MKRIYRSIRNYGFQGISIYIKLKRRKVKVISIPNISHPIHLRSASSDYPTFKQIFIDFQYKIDLGVYPEVIIDAGANIGLATVYFANTYPDSKIISIEPEISNYTLLGKNIENYMNIIPLYRALSNKSELLNVMDYGFGHWGYITSRMDEKNNAGKEIINQINTITIPEIMDQNNLEYIDIIKIDIEGYEKELFESNFEDWVPKTRCIIIELHDRLKEGCTTSFLNCMDRYDFSSSTNGENMIFMNNHLKTMPIAQEKSSRSRSSGDFK